MRLKRPLGMKLGRGMRQEYSTKWGRRQEPQCFRGSFPNRFLGEWTYILGLAAGWCRGGLTPPHPTQGSLEKGKREEQKGLEPVMHFEEVRDYRVGQ